MRCKEGLEQQYSHVYFRPPGSACFEIKFFPNGEFVVGAVNQVNNKGVAKCKHLKLADKRAAD
ncbi:MAG: hypothetical protein LC747_03975, partial [Acidobacteria bacterium]|nr:hypothetical protein [Acidobacteriota bacterium]